MPPLAVAPEAVRVTSTDPAPRLGTCPTPATRTVTTWPAFTFFALRMRLGVDSATYVPAGAGAAAAGAAVRTSTPATSRRTATDERTSLITNRTVMEDSDENDRSPANRFAGLPGGLRVERGSGRGRLLQHRAGAVRVHRDAGAHRGGEGDLADV